MNEKNESLAKVGTIILAVVVVENSWRDLCRTLFTKFCPFRTEMSPDKTKIAYTGFCDQFDEVGPDEVPPRYVMSCGFNNGVVQNVNFQRVQPKSVVPPPTKDEGDSK